jgi:hypothetical protein
LVDLIRAAALDQDIDSLIRYSASLGCLDQDLLGHAERDLISERHRLAGIEESRRARRFQRDENHHEWAAEAERYRSDNPDASERNVATHVAKVCEAAFETVRKALRGRQNKNAVIKSRK